MSIESTQESQSLPILINNFDRGINPAHLDTIIEMPQRESSSVYVTIH